MRQIMDWEDVELFEILDIIHDLEYNTLMERDDYETALSKMYDLVEGYFGFRTEFDEFVLDENGELKEHTIDEIHDFTVEMFHKALRVYMEKTKTGKDIFDDGKVYGYQGRDDLADLEIEVQTLY